MRLAAVLLGAVLAASSASVASAVVRITSDTGGQIGPYLETLAAIRDSGQRVIIDGPCLSACTMILGVIPRDRICVTRRARLGFHAAWHHGENGRPATNRGGTQLLMAVYPQNVKNWISKRGGLTREMKYLTGRELASMYPTCN
ncbi:MAG TPA: hypothetical protein VFB68_17690 [Xanthobacteraceae bacterium]|nr:hypothetical protein [Xanthobacteraceae bacterium]